MSVTQVKHVLLSDNEHVSYFNSDQYIDYIFYSFPLWSSMQLPCETKAHYFLFKSISAFTSFLYATHTANITPLFVGTYVMQVLADWPANSHSYIKLAGHWRYATLIKFK